MKVKIEADENEMINILQQGLVTVLPPAMTGVQVVNVGYEPYNETFIIVCRSAEGQPSES